MSALSILYLVLPFPLAFILHDAAMIGVELLLWGIAGIIFMAINLIFAHWIGKISHKTHLTHKY